MTLSPQSAALIEAAKAHRIKTGLVSDYGNGHIVYHATHQWKFYRDELHAAHKAIATERLDEDDAETLAYLRDLRDIAVKSNA